MINRRVLLTAHLTFVSFFFIISVKGNMHILFIIHINSKVTWFDINWLALLSSLIFLLKGQELKGKNCSSKIKRINK